jgi:hypothetical protein
MSSGPLVDAYLRKVASSMPGPAHSHSDILAELRSGLLDAADAYRSAGLPPGAAVEAAITEFGDPRQVADAFRPHLAMRHARRVALTLVVTGPLVGLLWTGAALASHITIQDAPPWQWPGSPPLSIAAFPVIGAALIITVWSALATVAATGKLARWLPASPRMAAATAAATGFGATAADLAIFALLASQLTRAPGTLAPLPVAAATAASLTRLTLARRAARKCLTITRYDYRELFERQAADIIQTDITHSGGLLEAKKLAGAAETHYMLMAPHNVGGPISTAANIHLAAATPNFAIQENFNDFADPYLKECERGLPEVTDGYFPLPDAPGLGIHLDYGTLAEHPRRQTYFNLFKEGWQHRRAEIGPMGLADDPGE